MADTHSSYSSGHRIVNEPKTIADLENQVESEGAIFTTLAQDERMRKKSLKWIFSHLRSCTLGLISTSPQLRLDDESAMEELECWLVKYYDAIKILGNRLEEANNLERIVINNIDQAILAASFRSGQQEHDCFLLDLAQLAKCFDINSFISIEPTGYTWRYQHPFFTWDSKDRHLTHVRRYMGKVEDLFDFKSMLVNQMSLERDPQAIWQDYEIPTERDYQIKTQRVSLSLFGLTQIDNAAKRLNTKLRSKNLKTFRNFDEKSAEYALEFEHQEH